MRFLRGLGALLVMVGVLVGGPVALLGVGRGLDLSGDLLDVLLRPDNGATLLTLLTGIGWVAWLAFTLSVAVETYAVVRRRRVRVPGLAVSQPLAYALVAAVTAMLVPPDQATAAGAAPVTYTTSTEAVAESAPPATAPPRSTVHVVRTGEHLWGIAEAHYGDGAQWRRIFDANRDVIGDPHRIDSGWRLTVPLDQPSSPAPAPTVRLVTPAALAQERAAETPASDHVDVPDVPDTQDVPDTPSVPDASDVPVPEPPVATPPELAGHASGEAGGVAPAGATARAASPADVLGVAVGGLWAGSVAALLASRRAAQQAGRPLGRAYVATPESVFATAVATCGTQSSCHALGAALREVARVQTGPLPALVGATLTADGLALRFDRPVVAPAGALSDGAGLRLGRPMLDGLVRRPGPEGRPGADRRPDADRPNPWGATITIGVGPDGSLELLDLETLGLVSLRGDRETVDGLVNALLVELTSGEWAEGVQVVLVGGDTEFTEALESPVLVHSLDVEAALRVLETRFDERPTALAGVRDLRVDPDQLEAWGPQVLVLDEGVTPSEAQRILALVDRGLCVVTTNTVGPAVQVRPAPELSTLPDGRRVVVQSVPRATRDALVASLRATRSTVTEPAPWWVGDPRITALPAADHKESATVDHTQPTVMLVGPIDLEGARGTRPSRAPRQCIEYAAWLLEHPGATSRQMANALFVAETTRRSNMSRLRTWLGAAPDGSPYLPEAYSGRINLHPAVTSDWDQLRLCVIGGVSRTPEAGLRRALELVRGAPLADTAPGQWEWAEELRLEMAATIRDIGVRLAGLALDRGDLDLARWATARALAAAPEDELLLCARVRTEALAGDLREVQRLAARLAAQARRLGVELSDETVELLQSALEGRVRARQVVGA